MHDRGPSRSPSSQANSLSLEPKDQPQGATGALVVVAIRVCKLLTRERGPFEFNSAVALDVDLLPFSVAPFNKRRRNPVETGVFLP